MPDDWHAAIEARIAAESAKRGKLWDELRGHESQCSQRHAEILSRLAAIEARQSILMRALVIGMTAIIAVEIGRVFA